jgi:hypothetical protein
MLSLSGLRWRGNGARGVFGNDPGMDFGVRFLRPLRFSVVLSMSKYILLTLSLQPTGTTAILCRCICSRVWRSGIMFRRYTVTLESVGTQLKMFAKAEDSPKRPAPAGAASGAAGPGVALIERSCAAVELDDIEAVDSCIEEEVGAVWGRDLDAGVDCASSVVDGLGIESQRETRRRGQDSETW